MLRNFLFFIILILILFQFHDFLTGFKSAAIRAKQRGCFAQIREIQGGLEMYFMDSKTEVYPSKNFDLNNLVSGGYLKDMPICPFQGQYNCKTSSDSMEIFCTFHGNFDQTIPGKIDPGYSSMFWLYDWVGGMFSG